MGKFMRKNRSSHVSVLPVENRGFSRQRIKFDQESSSAMADQQPSKKIQLLLSLSSSSGDENAGDFPPDAGEYNVFQGRSSAAAEEIEQAADEESSSSSERGEEDAAEEFVSRGPEAVKSADSRHLLRESHSDSCLSRGRRPITGHSRSNSACFGQDQVLGLSTEQDQVTVEEESPKVCTTKEGEASCGDNTLVLFSSITKKRSREEFASSSTVTPPASSSRRQTSFHLGGGEAGERRDCGPGWRHRVASAPTTDEIEEFFAGVEQEKDDRKRFLDKYNFDVFNDVPLPGRFEWVQFQQS